MSAASLTVLYPHPEDAEQFERDYREHIALLHEKMAIPTDARPYTAVLFASPPDAPAPYHRMFHMPFPSLEALEQTMASPAMQEVAADAARISTGGPLTILVGGEG